VRWSQKKEPSGCRTFQNSMKNHSSSRANRGNGGTSFGTPHNWAPNAAEKGKRNSRPASRGGGKHRETGNSAYFSGRGR
jgi:hypothetical protein